MNTTPVNQADPDLIAVARRLKPADLLLVGGAIVNVFNGHIEQASIAIHRGRIAGVGDYTQADEYLNISGSFVAPGFIDAHMHVESTLMPPTEFVRLAAPHGTTGVVLDPHEIANVAGVEGIRWIMKCAKGLPINAMFALSSCVPASPLETSGAVLTAADLAPLFNEENVVALAEMMNFPGVVHAAPDVLEKVQLGLSRSVVDGHAPGLRGADLQAYIGAGVSSDHECTTLEESLEKLRHGMRIYIREGSAAKNLEALLPAVTPANLHRFSFCTDDRHPADLKNEGHIDHVVRKAVHLGMNPAHAITIASLFTAQHYGKRDIGAIAPGYLADMIIFDDLSDIRPRLVFFHGERIAENGEYLLDRAPLPPGAPVGVVKLPANLTADSFAIKAPANGVNIRVIGMDPHQLVTEHLVLPPSVENGQCVADTSRDILKLAVIERHRGTGNIGLGFVQNFGFKAGAIASTVGHDSHNLAIVGANDADMLVAARALAQAGGGQCAVRDGEVLALLPLPIGGLMSDAPAETIIEQQHALHEATRALGCPHADPFMPLSFLPLSVIPKLKLSDQGLVDVEKFELVSLAVE